MLRAGSNRSFDMRHSTAILALPLLAVLTTGCATSGAGAGATLSGADLVTFSWKSSDSVSGTMTATTPEGTAYTGRFFQVTRDTTVDSLGPLWTGRGRWGGLGWDDWSAGPSFITHYTGKVVANLGAPSGAHMRCKFQLVYPSQGRAGGGHGRCQMPDGKTIDATFPAA
jgi:hypothetical protein